MFIAKGSIDGFESHAKKPCSKCKGKKRLDNAVFDKKYCKKNDITVCDYCERVILDND